MSWLALAIDAAARVQHTEMKGDLSVSWGRGVWVSVSDSVRVGLARLFTGSHTLYRRPINSACWILKWWVSTANLSDFLVLFCSWFLNWFPSRQKYADWRRTLTHTLHCGLPRLALRCVYFYLFLLSPWKAIRVGIRGFTFL